MAPLVKTFTVSVTGTELRIDFVHQVENPKISGIEILPATLAASADDLHAVGRPIGDRQRQRDVHAGGHRLRSRLQRGLRERDQRDPDGDGGQRLDVRRLERRLYRHWKLRGVDERNLSVGASFTAALLLHHAAPSLTIYGDALASDWSNWSWGATVNLAGTSPVRVGSRAANVTYQGGWGGFSLRKGAALATSGLRALVFWVHGGTGSNKSLRVFTQASDSGAESSAVLVTAIANSWTEITVPLSSFGSPSSIKRISIQNNSAVSQPTLTFDEVRLVP